jgi:hypothetical protein
MVSGLSLPKAAAGDALTRLQRRRHEQTRHTDGNEMYKARKIVYQMAMVRRRIEPDTKSMGAVRYGR